jgi:hypothetical protein
VSEPITSRPYRPSGEMCCNGCVFGRGGHLPTCPIVCDEKLFQRYVDAAFCYPYTVPPMDAASPAMPPDKIMMAWRDRKGKLHSRLIEDAR